VLAQGKTILRLTADHGIERGANECDPRSENHGAVGRRDELADSGFVVRFGYADEDVSRKGRRGEQLFFLFTHTCMHDIFILY